MKKYEISIKPIEIYPFIEAVIKSSEDAEAFCREYIYKSLPDALCREYSYAIFLNRANEVIGFFELGKGGTTYCVMDIKLIAKMGISLLADSVMLVHNHTSKNSNPSKSDIDITLKAKKGLDLLDIRLLDHIIIANNSYYSFVDNCII